MKEARFIVVGIVMLFGVGILAIAAQSEPTTAPSKTPTTTAQPSETVTDETPATTVPASSVLTEPFTQVDLTRLTGNVQRPNGIVWFDDYLYTACSGDGTVYEIQSETGQTRTYIWGVQNAHTLHAEMNNGALNLWVPDYEENALVRVTRSGVETIADELNGPWGIAVVDEDRFLVTNLLSNSLNIVTRGGENIPTMTGLAAPTGVLIDEEVVYVANNGSTRRAIEWYPLDDVLNGDAEPGENANLVSGVQNVTGLVSAPDGYLYFAYSIGTRGVVGRVNPGECRENGGCTGDQVEIVVYTELEAPLAGLTISPDMRLFVHTMFSPDLYWIDLNG